MQDDEVRNSYPNCPSQCSDLVLQLVELMVAKTERPGPRFPEGARGFRLLTLRGGDAEAGSVRAGVRRTQP